MADIAGAVNIYSTQRAVNNSSTSAETLAFGFIANRVRIDNLGAVDLHINFDGTATTGDWILGTSDGHRVVDLSPVRLESVSITSTSVAGEQISILALE